jgi:hypothetical protein
VYGLPTLAQGLNASEMVIAGAEDAAGFSSAFFSYRFHRLWIEMLCEFRK